MFDVVVLSPHLDDAALSIGALIHALARSGRSVSILTVFANDPENQDKPSRWDISCGFQTAAEAARTRRLEDAAACIALGASPIWLPLPDVDYRSRPREEDGIWQHVSARLDGRELLLLPGWPLTHPDHDALLRAVLPEAIREGFPVGVFVEQPYAVAKLLDRRLDDDGAILRTSFRLLGATLRGPDLPTTIGATLHHTEEDPLADWRHHRLGVRDRRAKYRAIRAYRSQLRILRPPVIIAVRLYEIGAGGETVAWPAGRPGGILL